MDEAGIHPAPIEFSEAQIETDPILHFFHYAHLPPRLRQTSAGFAHLASVIVITLPQNAERAVALRKLLEAKDCAVRANLPEHQKVSKCVHPMIFAAFDVGSNGPAPMGKCTRCQERVSTDGYAQSAARAEGFLTKLPDRKLGEPVEIGGHDEDRNGPVDFGS